MKNWLENIKPPKYLRYLFFIAYSFYRRFTSERSDAHFTSILFLTMINLLAYQAVHYLFNLPASTSLTLFILLFAAIQFYIWFWLNDKWKVYITEFEHITRKKQLLGGFYLLLYLVLCICIGFLQIIIKLAFGIRI